MDAKMNLRNMTAIYIIQKEKMLMLYRVGSRVVAPSWCGIGGHFETSELNNPHACMVRELEEESAIREDMLENLKFKYITLRLKNGEVRQNYYYFASLKDDAEVSLESEEGRLQWVPLDEVMEKEMPLTAKYMMEHYLAIGRFDDKLYSGTTLEDKMIFTELREF